MSDNLSIQEVLISLGYHPVQDKDGYRMAAIYRSGDNNTALKVYNDFWCQDFVTGERFNLETLIKRTLNIDDVKAKEFLAGKNIDIKKAEYKEKLKVTEFFDEELLKDLVQDFSYITDKRSISLETAKTFSCGICLDSQKLIQKLKNRQIFCIYNSQKKLVGFSGRALDDNNKIRHKHLGIKSLWVYPAHLNTKIIKETKEVFLVEGIFDLMRLWDLNIKNVLVLWGTEASFSIVNYLLKINPKTIYICTNNELDSDNGGVGNEASKKIFGRLKKYFNLNQIKIYLPSAKDFCEIKEDQVIKNWYNKRYD